MEFVEGCARSLDPSARLVETESGDRFAYDLLSVDIGSVVDDALGDQAWPVKPLSELTRLRETFETARPAAKSIIVAGAGPTGTEVAACLAGLFERLDTRSRVGLVGARNVSGAWRDLYRSLERRGVSLIDGKVVESEGHAVRLEDGRSVPCGLLIAATGLRAASLSAPLKRGDSRGIAVDATLRSASDPAIFACGDCADFLPRPLPKHGVFGVRQAPVLLHNLIAAAHGEPLVPYTPQKNWLSIMDLGNGEGFATWGPFAWRGRAALAVKRRLDLGFVRRFQ